MPVVALVMLAFACVVVMAEADAGSAAAATATSSAVNARTRLGDVGKAAMRVYVRGPGTPWGTIGRSSETLEGFLRISTRR